MFARNGFCPVWSGCICGIIPDTKYISLPLCECLHGGMDLVLFDQSACANHNNDVNVCKTLILS